MVVGTTNGQGILNLSDDDKEKSSQEYCGGKENLDKLETLYQNYEVLSNDLDCLVEKLAIEQTPQKVTPKTQTFEEDDFFKQPASNALVQRDE